MSEAVYTAAAVQMASGSNVQANLLEAEKIVEAAAGSGARLVVLPENFSFMGDRCADVLIHKEADGDGPLQDFLAGLARRLGIWLVGGTIPVATDDPAKIRAASILFNDQGERVARYDKIHLFDVHLVETEEQYVESDSIEPGEVVKVVDTPFGRLGIAICYDLRFPELFRAMLDQQVEVIAIPAAFTALTGKAHWESLIRARAIENLSFVVAAAQGGFHINGRETWGHSMLVDPWGNILGERSRGTGFISANLDPTFQTATRRNFPSIAHRKI
ncbi:MAG: carbon-nitrogen hydrolase family protein [bacterium]